MKKILFIILLFSFFYNVQAEEYSSYSDFGPFVSGKIKSNDLVDVKEERRYKYYKYVKDYGPYGSFVNSEYKYLDDSDYIFTDYSLYDEEKPLEKENRVIEDKIFYKYLKVGPIDEVVIKADSDIIITDFKLYENDVLLDYQLEGSFGDLAEGEEIVLKLNKKVDLDCLKYSIFSGGESSDLYNYSLYFKGDGTVYQDITSSIFGDYSITFKNSIFGYINYYEYLSDVKLNTSKSLKFVGEVVRYRYKDKLFHLYNLNREYYYDYLIGPYMDYIYKDENLYKDYYACRTREKIAGEVVMVPNTSDEAEKSNDDQITPIDYFNAFYTMIILVIIFLVLSKRYKNKKRYGKLNLVMLC